MAIIKYTTPTQEIVLQGIDLTNAEYIYVTYRNGNFVRTFDGDAVEVEAVEEESRTDTKLLIDLGQDFTGCLDAMKELLIQVNWIMDGERCATKIKRRRLYPNLLEEVRP